MDALQESPVMDRIIDTVSGTGVTVATIGAVSVPPAAPVLAVVGASFLGLGLFRNAWKFGKPAVEKMVEDLDAEANSQYRRIWEALNGHTDRQQEFEARLQGQEAETARISALFHGLRTPDPEKHSRLARLTINCIFVDDLKPESLDGMMRAAVELTSFDVSLLGDMCEFAMRPKYASSSQSKDQVQPDLFGIWKDYWHAFPTKCPGISRSSVVGGFGRLSALGLIYGLEATSTGISPVSMNYWITEEGMKFYGRMQEIAVQQ